MDVTDLKKDSTVYFISRQYSNKKIDQTLNYQSPVWPDDIIIVTTWDKGYHRGKLFTILEQLQEAGYGASEKKSEFCFKEIIWLGHKIIEHGLKPNKEKIKAILQLKPPTSCQELNLFLGALQCIAQFLPKLSENNRPIEPTTPEEIGKELERKRRIGLYRDKKKDNRNTVFSTFC